MDIGLGYGAYAEGGLVEQGPQLMRGGMLPGPAGKVNGPPGYDQVPATVRSPDGQQHPTALTDGEYVIPADVVRTVGTGPLDDIIEKARKRKEQGKQSPDALRRMN